MELRRLFSSKAVSVVLLFLFIGSFVPKSHALTAEEERVLGKQVFSEIEKTGTLLNDLSLWSFVNKLGQSLVREAGATPFEFRFYMMRSQEPNAFAIPGGYVFVTTGLLVMAESEEEIAGVLSHEIAHVTMRHISQLIDRSKRISIASMAAMLAGMLLAGGGRGGEAIATTAMAAQQAFMLKYSREHETDADQNGLRYLIRDGYDPNGMVSFMKKIARYGMTAGPKIPTYLSTHPDVVDRIALLENLIRIEPTRPGPQRIGGSYKFIQSKAFVYDKDPYVAVNHFESVVKNDPQDTVGLFGLGFAHQKAGRLDKSIEVLEKALSFTPRDPDILRELGVSYFLAGRTDEAVHTLDQVRPSLPTAAGEKDDLTTLYYLGKAYQEKTDFLKAIEFLLKVEKEAPDFQEVYHSLGSVYGRMGDKGQSHFYFGKYFKLRGDRNGALFHFRAALEGLKRGSPEREEAQREVKGLTQGKP
jgi:beta-barrel assembly-enhancing protease